MASEDSISFFLRKTKEDVTPNLDQRLDYLNQAISYSKRGKDSFHELFFLEQLISTNFSFAKYDVQDIIDESLLRIEQGISKCDSSERGKWERLHIQMLADRCVTSIMSNDYGECSDILLRMGELYGTAYAHSKIHMCRGIMSAHKLALEEALKYFDMAEKESATINDIEGVFKAKSNKGLALLAMNRYEDAVSLFLQCHQVAVENHYQGDKLICSYQYLAQGYTGLGNYSLANRYYQEAIRLATQHNQARLLCFTQYNYARSLYLEGKYSQAEMEANTALRLFEQNGFVTMKAETLSLLKDIYVAQKDYQVAYVYLSQYVDLVKGFWQEEQAKNLEKLESSLETYKLRQKIQEIELKETQMRYRNLLVILLTSLLLLLLIGIVVLLRRFFKQKRINQSAMVKIEELKSQTIERTRTVESHLNSEIGSKNKALLANSLLFLRISSIATSLQEKIQEIKKAPSLSGKEKLVIYEMEHLVINLDPEQDWGEFESYFKEPTGDFLSKISERYPALSAYEKRICALFSLNLSNKEISTLMNRSVQSISMAKNRIRKKMGLETDKQFMDAITHLC